MRIKESLEMVLHFVQRVSHACRVCNRSYMLLPGVESQGDPSRSGVEKMPFHAIDVGLSVRISIVSWRRNNSRGGSRAYRRKRRCVGRRNGMSLALRQGDRKHREQKT